MEISPVKSEENQYITLEEDDDEEPVVAKISYIQGKSVDEYYTEVTRLIKLCHRYCADLQGWQNYSDFSGVHRALSGIQNQISSMISKIFIHQDVKLNINGYKLTDQFEIIKEGNDTICERTNSDLDDASGKKKQADVQICDTTLRTVRGPVNQTTGRDIILIASRNVEKPQMFFNPKISNSATEPFIPVLKEKPNSMKPLSIMLCMDIDGGEYYSHPYEYELQHWNPTDGLLQKREPEKPLLISETPFDFIDSEEKLNNMVIELKKVQEIAVDLEHHSFRTYQGLTCLIQISTRHKDYFIDPFPLRNFLPALNEVFTDPKISKVFHGANNDILWLQRDCGVYVVNMFDTHQAAVVLEYPHKSLAYLLTKFCNLVPDKSYQRSDWRIRPLPENFVEYARQDAHCLLFIHDCMKNELIEKGNELNNLLSATYDRSTELCMKRYEKPIVGPDSHMDMYRRSKKHFTGQQLYALQQIYSWRDKLARQHDESVDFVLPRHMMFQMAEVLPKEVQGILACCNPIPTYVKTERLTLHQIIRTAREMALEETTTDEKEVASLTQMLDTNDPMSALECRYDLSLMEENSKGLSTILNPQETLFGDMFSENAGEVIMKKKSTMFGVPKLLLEDYCRGELSHLTEEYMNPFFRYNISLDQRLQLEEKELEEDRQKQMAIEESDKARMDKIKGLYMSLSSRQNISPPEDSPDVAEETLPDLEKTVPKVQKTLPNTAEILPNVAETSNSDQARMERLQFHIASLTASIRATTTYRPEAKPQSSSEQWHKERRRERNQPMKNDKSPKYNQKRKSSENGADISDKKMKVEEGEEENDDGKKMKVEGEEENDEKNTEGMEEEEELEEGEIIEEEEISPFDYAKANYSIFKPRNSKKFKGQNIKQQYKKKGRNKPTGFRKGSVKSMSWGRNS